MTISNDDTEWANVDSPVQEKKNFKLTVKPGLGEGEHDVFLNGEKIGRIYQRIQHYNLRRHFVSTWYEVTLDGAKWMDSHGDVLQYARLRDARADIELEISRRTNS